MNDSRQTNAASRRPALLGAIALAVAGLLVPASAGAQDFTVDDPGDTSTCDPVTACTLRGALELATSNGQADTITFSSAMKISPLAILPEVPSGTTINGKSAPGWGAGGQVVQIDGSLTTVGAGLQLGDQSIVQGLAITGFKFGPGVLITGSNSALSDNTIAFNAGGIRLEPLAGAGNDLRGNSIHDNAGANGSLGIDLWPFGPTLNDAGDSDAGPNNLQNYPEIATATVSAAAGTLTIDGTLDSVPSSSYEIEFYASTECSPTGFGEGEVVLGSTTVSTDTSGRTAFTAQIFTPFLGTGLVITATATDNDHNTSEFSRCVTATTAPPPAGGPVTVAPAAAPQPVAGESVVTEKVSGTVLVKLPGTKQYVPLDSAMSIPVGSVVDARKGRVRLTVAAGDGTTSAEFYSGRFRIAQQKNKSFPLTTLTLVDKASGCSKTARKSGPTTAKKKKKRKKKHGLWGDGDGKYRTKGDNGSATVRGTKWHTVNRCDGTLFSVARGVVYVRDFNRKKTIRLKQGKKYLAKAR